MLQALLIPKVSSPSLEEVQAQLASTNNELNHIREINKAIVDGKSLEEIAQLFMNAVIPTCNIFSCRIYMYNENKLKLMVLADHHKNGSKELLEKKLGIKLENIVPNTQKGSLFYDLVHSDTVRITNNRKEILAILRAHTNSSVLKGLAGLAIKLVKIKSFGSIPLRVNGKNIGLITFASNKVLSDKEQQTISTYTEHISAGLTRKIAERLLDEQEKFSKELLDQLPVSLMVFNEDGTCKLANKACIADESIRSWVIGKQKEEISEKMNGNNSRFDIGIFQEENTFQPMPQTISESIDPDGSIRYSLNIVKPISIAEIQNTIAYSVDVTDLMHAQNELIDTQRIAQMGSFEFNINTTSMKFDPFILDMLGCDPKKNFGFQEFYTCIEPQYKSAFLSAISMVTEEKKLNDLELVVINQRKEKIDICINAFCIKRDNNVPVLRGMIQNISARKNADKQIKSEHKLLNESQALGVIGSWELVLNDLNDWSKNTCKWSDEAYRIFGYEPGSIEVSYERFMRHVHPDDNHIIENLTGRLFKERIPQSNIYRIILNDGTPKYIYAKLAFEFDETNQPVKLLGITQDITRQKQLEIKIENYNHQLEMNVKRKTQELSIANQNLDAFNQSISHDLRVILRGMEIYTDVLIAENENNINSNTEYLQKIKGGILQMNDMISAMLEFARSGRGEMDKAVIDMDFLIRHCLDSVVHVETKKPVEIIINETPAIMGDYKLINQVLNNLISNAVKYSSKKSNPVIKISGKVDNDFVIYSIEDNGDGFDAKLLDKLFKPFSRLHIADEFEGNGVGLAIVNRIINRHGGSVWANAEKGKGAIFYFKVPVN